MDKFLQKLIFRLFQPLTKKPAEINACVSDLFLWLNSPDVNSLFHLISIKDIFSPTHDLKTKDIVVLKIFNTKGGLISSNEILINNIGVNTIKLSDYLVNCQEKEGVFSIFYNNPLKIFSKYQSYLSERGYTSYGNTGSEIRAFVHGNLDAISLGPSGQIEPLGGIGFLYRKYNLQYLFESNFNYDLYISNPTGSDIRVECSIINISDLEIATKMTQIIPSMGLGKFNLKFDGVDQYRIVLKSRLVMTRPVVVKRSKILLDVFHG